jgi:hypothetical protein
MAVRKNGDQSNSLAATAWRKTIFDDMLRGMVKLTSTAIFATTLVFVQSCNGNDASALRLPAPGGQFPVGRVTYHWTDPSRLEPLSLRAGAHREIVVYVWYPAAKSAKARQPAPYFPHFKTARAAIADKDLKYMFHPAEEEIEKGHLPLTHALERASMPLDKVSYPVLVFSHGWGMQSTLYTAALEDLASQGYVVVGGRSSLRHDSYRLSGRPHCQVRPGQV